MCRAAACPSLIETIGTLHTENDANKTSFTMQNISQPFLLLLPFLSVFPAILVDASIQETFKKGIFEAIWNCHS